MNIDCPDCGTDEWCAKHLPVTEPAKCPVMGHPVSLLAESWGWCPDSNKYGVPSYNLWTPEQLRMGYVRPEDSLMCFDTYQELNEWFIANVTSSSTATARGVTITGG